MIDLSQDIWRSLVDNAPSIIMIVDQTGTIEYINQAMPGLDTTEVIGLNHFNSIDPAYLDIARESIKKVFEDGKPRYYEVKAVGIDGQPVWYSNTAGPIRKDGKIVSVSLFSNDITDRKQAEEDLLTAKDEMIQAQSKAILELSTPVIQVWDQILILPLIGSIDTRRAQQLVEDLLGMIVNTQASVAIIDVTGVAVVDTSVANHLISTIEAAKMLGTDVILTGVSPHNAQILVKLGVNLGSLTTKGSLQSGLRLAFQLTKRLVVDEEQQK